MRDLDSIEQVQIVFSATKTELLPWNTKKDVAFVILTKPGSYTYFRTYRFHAWNLSQPLALCYQIQHQPTKAKLNAKSSFTVTLLVTDLSRKYSPSFCSHLLNSSKSSQRTPHLTLWWYIFVGDPQLTRDAVLGIKITLLYIKGLRV